VLKSITTCFDQWHQVLNFLQENCYLLLLLMLLIYKFPRCPCVFELVGCVLSCRSRRRHAAFVFELVGSVLSCSRRRHAAYVFELVGVLSCCTAKNTRREKTIHKTLARNLSLITRLLLNIQSIGTYLRYLEAILSVRKFWEFLYYNALLWNPLKYIKKIYI
jgi:hypothetical protein